MFLSLNVFSLLVSGPPLCAVSQENLPRAAVPLSPLLFLFRACQCQGRSGEWDRSTKSIVLKSICNVSNIIFQKYEIIYFYLYSLLLFICFLLFNRKEISRSWTSVNVTMTEQALGKIINSITGWKNTFVKLARWSLFFLTTWTSMYWKFCLASRENKQLRNFSKIHRNWEQTLTKRHSQMIWHPSHCIRWSCVQKVRLLIITASWGSEKFQDCNAATCLEPRCNIEGPEDPQCIRG